MVMYNTEYEGKVYLDYVSNKNKMVEFIVNTQRVMDLCAEFQFQRIANKITSELPPFFRTDKDYEEGIKVLRKYVVFTEGGR